MPLRTAVIEALATGCGKLRYAWFYVRLGEAGPALIRFLIDCIVAHPSWILQTGQLTLMMHIVVMRDSGDEAGTGNAASHNKTRDKPMTFAGLRVVYSWTVLAVHNLSELIC